MSDPDHEMLREVSITVGRMETKLDLSLADLQRRAAESEADRRTLHGRVTGAERDISSLQARTGGLEKRVGGAFSKYVPVAVSGLAVVVTIVLTVARW